MATQLEAAIANEMAFHIDDLLGEVVTDAQDSSMGTTYIDTTLQPGGSGTTMHSPNEFTIVLGNGKHILVTVCEVPRGN
jgi:hypothetical protein